MGPVAIRSDPRKTFVPMERLLGHAVPMYLEANRMYR
jgi:hypothetical protein